MEEDKVAFISTENGLIGGKKFFQGCKHMIIFKRERQASLKFKNYIEGQLDFDTFWSEFIVDNYLITVLMRFSAKKRIGGISKSYFLDYPERRENPDFFTKYLLQWTICKYLDHKKIKYNSVVKEYYLYEKWDDYIPNFVPYSEKNYIYLENLENGKRRSKKYYRDLYSKIYRYEKYPPRWMHFSEWPFDDDGTPTKFLYQTGFPNNHDFIEYWFEKKDGTKIKIEQYD